MILDCRLFESLLLSLFMIYGNFSAVFDFGLKLHFFGLNFFLFWKRFHDRCSEII